MRDEPLFILAALAALAVTVILAVGIGGFARGGEFNRRHGNRMMRWRIIAQAIAVALILLYVWLRGN
ncbi:MULTISPECIES: twin transmembrane helix small protein [unclassified Paracoccus (in: a-proteobacteria)]|uniref:twin transmembrane helix small protein n=1 Tax=unclassified Paracoccus (in: a-proteobacteria) TaxID=2688777 RepID=UPI00160447E1|nr:MULTISPECIES: twin transmembrane helix small protein [unclassified Paracoccus (in: a-proteobacteria)]MBB1493223.1 twin transmembrane helix small protein [Paracoccus sp. MC1854]MBB1499692.1 twin transmembrane helix small protein [Paracoccus sp. MC1862]MDO5371528.1 twin transmembrane helix small protein [Paracoccus sp. (in: a-proteobacteria)]QQO44430.1 twin transmembrane helix small protein [Paracoccus sp. MC1862]